MVSEEFKNSHPFDHPFVFYLIKNFGNMKSVNFLDKLVPMEIGLLLDGFLGKFGFLLNFFFNLLFYFF